MSAASAARNARRLSTLLSHDAGTDVVVAYVRPLHGYQVRWDDGPAEDEMRRAAATHQDQAPLIPMQGLAYQRRQVRP